MIKFDTIGELQRHYGFLFEIIMDGDFATPEEQIAKRFAHGGGWMPLAGFELDSSEGAPEGQLVYAGDPPTEPIATAPHQSNEGLSTIYWYKHGWMTVLRDGEYKGTTRID